MNTIVAMCVGFLVCGATSDAQIPPAYSTTYQRAEIEKWPQSEKQPILDWLDAAKVVADRELDDLASGRSEAAFDEIAETAKLLELGLRDLANYKNPAVSKHRRKMDNTMKRVTGIGGIFFKAKDAPALQAWYKRHLGIDVQAWGGASFDWTDAEGKPVAGTTAWLIDPQESNHFAPSSASFMVNYRVEDLHALVKVLKEEGCNVLEKIDESEYGKFAWVIDPEGNKVELWQPPVGQ